MDNDGEVTITQVMVTIVIGAVIGVLLTLLLWIASPTVRDGIFWIGPCIIGLCIGICLWLRYAPWWADFPFPW